MEEKQELNLIKIGTYTRVNGVLRFANVLLKERNFRDIHFRALGSSIGKLVSVVELLKLTHPGMYQTNTIGTVAFQLKEKEEEVMNERLYPKLEIVLSLDPPSIKGIGFQDKLAEEERSRLCGIMERGGGYGTGMRSFRSRGGRSRSVRGGFGRGNFFGRGRGRGRGFASFSDVRGSSPRGTRLFRGRGLGFRGGNTPRGRGRRRFFF